MLAFEIIINIGKYLEFEDKIKLKKANKFLNGMIEIRMIPDKYWDKINCNMIEIYPKAKYEGILLCRKVCGIIIDIRERNKLLKDKNCKYIPPKKALKPLVLY